MMQTPVAEKALIEAAIRLIHARGYADVDIDAICHAAGVEPADFPRHFATKADLAIAALDAQYALAEAYILDRAFVPDLPPVARIMRFFTIAWEANRAARAEHGCMLGCPFGNLAAELGQREPAIRERLIAIFQGYQARFEGALAEAVAAGDLPPQDVRETAEALLAYFQGLMLVAMLNDRVDVLGTLASKVPGLIGQPGARP